MNATLTTNVKANLSTAIRKAHRWITDVLPTSDETGAAIEKARRWMVTVMSGNEDAGTARDRVFPGEDGRWYFWTRGEHGAARRLEGPFADKDGALRILDRHVRDSNARRRGFQLPRTWSPMRLRRRYTVSEQTD